MTRSSSSRTVSEKGWDRKRRKKISGYLANGEVALVRTVEGDLEQPAFCRSASQSHLWLS